jgi:uncharacterized YigZ family protein
MITIKGGAETSFVVKKSKFIGFAVRIDGESQVQSEIEKRKKQHYDATHNCFAYVLENGVMRYSDDGEPQGTAGVPMLEVLKKSGLTDVIVISTRYFGGTLLGAGGLARAYTQNAADTLAAARRVQRIECGIFQCRFEFAAWARAEKALALLGFAPDEVLYADAVTVDYSVNPGEEERFLQAVINITQGRTSPVPLGTKIVQIDI